jgi:hypothetical protein
MAEVCGSCGKLLSGSRYEKEQAFATCDYCNSQKEVVKTKWVICDECNAVCKHKNGNSSENYECPDCGGELREITSDDAEVGITVARNNNSWAALRKEEEIPI